MKGLNDLMQQAQDMQKKMQDAQASLQDQEVTGEAGAGLIKIVMNGRHDVKQVNIDASLFNEEKEILEDLVAAAVNDAVKKVEKTNSEKMAGLTSGLNLPEGFKMPF